MTKTNKVRRTVSSRIYAMNAYPGLHSKKAATARYLDIVLDSDQSLNLARHLVQGAREAAKLTLCVSRKPAAKTKTHAVSVTYAIADQK
jgi:hypothetical protein